MAERRETNDRILVRCLLKRQLPLLAIGLGMQQLNVALGGTLYMHLPEDKPRSMPHTNRDGEGPHRHLVLLEPGTRLEEIYGGEELLVNSEHHQAVREVAEGMRICATAPDTVIEAITSSIDTDCWEENGGNGAIESVPITGALVISQTRKIHKQIEAFLATLREARDIMAASTFVREAFGADVQEHYAHFFAEEATAYDNAVTDWERRRYFERI